MSDFVDGMLSAFFAWLQGLVNWAWAIVDQGGSALGTWFLRNWLPLTLILVAAGLVVDWCIWMIRWRPYHVWATRLRKIGGFFSRRKSPLPATESGTSSEDWQPEAEPAWQGPSAPEEPLVTQGSAWGGEESAQDTARYVPSAYMAQDNPDFAPENEAGLEDTYIGNPGGSLYEAPMLDQRGELLPLDEDEIQWEDVGAPTTVADTWDGQTYDEAEETWAVEDPLSFAPGETYDDQAYDGKMPAGADDILHDDEAEAEYEDDDEDSPAQQPEGGIEALPGQPAPVWDSVPPDAAAPGQPEWEEEEPMFDDYQRDLPEPPQKRRRWELRQEEEEDSYYGDPNPDNASGDIDALADYDAPEVLRRIGSAPPPRAQESYDDEAAYDDLYDEPYEEADGGMYEPPQEQAPVQNSPAGGEEAAGSTRRRRSDRHRQAAPAAEEAPPSARPGRSRRAGRQPTQEIPPQPPRPSLDKEDSFYSDPDYEGGTQTGDDYDNDDYYENPAPESDLPDAADWPDWNNPPALPRREAPRGPTKPSLFDRLRGMGRSPAPEDGDVEAAPPKRNRLANLLNPNQEFSAPKPKPRVNQQDAFRAPVYPDRDEDR